MELDSVNSSDALLMNIFCHPGVVADGALSPAVARLLGVEEASQPCFGINPRVPLRSGRLDRTEIDMHLGDLFVEAKLTLAFVQKSALPSTAALAGVPAFSMDEAVAGLPCDNSVSAARALKATVVR